MTKLAKIFTVFSFFVLSAQSCDDVHPCKSDIDCAAYVSFDTQYYCGEYAGKQICIPTNPVMQQKLLASIGSNTADKSKNMCDVPHTHNWGPPTEWTAWQSWKGNCKFRSKAETCTICGTTQTIWEQVPPNCFM